MRSNSPGVVEDRLSRSDCGGAVEFRQGAGHRIRRSYALRHAWRAVRALALSLGLSLCLYGSTSGSELETATAQPACVNGCSWRHIDGTSINNSPAGSISTPVNSTYSYQHLVGGDTQGNGTTSCFFIFDQTLPGAPDDVVTFDGLPEALRTDQLGTVPTVTESMVDTGDGTRLLILESSSPNGTDLFPGGLTDESTETALTDACLFVGLLDPLADANFGAVTQSQILFLRDGVTITGPIDLTGSPSFSDPWNGRFLASFPSLAGLGINTVRLEIRVAWTGSGSVNACCQGESCLADIEEKSCTFQGGSWQHGASCGREATFPAPICAQPDCGFDNGPPLDDVGGPVSRFEPDLFQSASGVDDFLLQGERGRCLVTQIRAFMTHDEAPSGVDPAVDYDGVTVTIYRDNRAGQPRGRPLGNGTHLPDVPGGIVYMQTFAMNLVAVSPVATTCLPDLWQLEIPVDALLERNVRYWLEVQPILSAAKGRSIWALSQNQNERVAQAYGVEFGITDWESIGGNESVCPDGTPPAGSRSNLAFQIVGSPSSQLRNDNCAEALVLTDGIVTYTNEFATTDGNSDPLCDEFFDAQVSSDVWYTYTASCTGDVTISLCGADYDTKMAAYAGCGRCPPADSPIVCNDESCLRQSEVRFAAEAGACFTVRIGGFSSEQGAGIVTVTCEPPPIITGACCVDGRCIGTLSEAQCAVSLGSWFEGTDCIGFACPIDPPPHDACENAIALITGESFSGTTRGSGGINLNSCAFNDRNDVWHVWTADCSGNAKITLCETFVFDTTLAVYDACGGQELACDDDACDLQSKIDPLSQRLAVYEGGTYYIRVSGFNFATDDYTILVESCVSGCCLPGGLCVVREPEVCEAEGGISLAPGTFCRGFTLNGIDLACPQCPAAQIVEVSPPSSTVDARQPHVPGDAVQRQGIGTADDPIVLTLSPSLVAPAECFRFCETTSDATLGPNEIVSVTNPEEGVFGIELAHPLTPGAMTTVRYFATGSTVRFFSHPANVDGSAEASEADVLAMVNCCLSGSCSFASARYSCDIDHSGDVGPGDLLRVIDLLNGADGFATWQGSELPGVAGCP